jgi:hypothetical protein
MKYSYFDSYALPEGIDIAKDRLFKERYEYDIFLVEEGDLIVSE